jgi:hypothetical protein
MSDSYDKVRNHYEENVGTSPYDLFDIEGSTTRVGDYAISTGRFVTIRYEAWGIQSFGPYAGVHIQVYKNRVMTDDLFIEPRMLQIMAQSYKSRIETMWPAGVSWSSRWVHLGTSIQIASHYSDRSPDWKEATTLTRDEVEYMLERLAPILSYKPLADHRDPSGEPPTDENKYVSVWTEVIL